MELLHTIINFLVETMSSLGYIGIFILMFLESSFFPFPSEVVMIPAGFLAYKGDMNLFIAIAMGSIGSLTGGLFNYYLSKTLGRKLLLRYGHYVFFDEEKLQKVESFFATHGEISTFNGRLIPVVRQYISLPAGLANMNIVKFSIFTTLGAAIWVSILTMLGYFLGNQSDLIKEYLHIITIATIIILALVTFIYIKRHR